MQQKALAPVLPCKHMLKYYLRRVHFFVMLSHGVEVNTVLLDI